MKSYHKKIADLTARAQNYLPSAEVQVALGLDDITFYIKIKAELSMSTAQFAADELTAKVFNYSKRGMGASSYDMLIRHIIVYIKTGSKTYLGIRKPSNKLSNTCTVANSEFNLEVT